MKFREFCNQYFQKLTPVQEDYVRIVDDVISKMNKVRHFNYDCSLRSSGLTTIKCAHAAWILHENPLAIVLIITPSYGVAKHFKNNVVTSFYASANRLVELDLYDMHIGKMPRGIRFDFVFSECDFPKHQIMQLTKI